LKDETVVEKRSFGSMGLVKLQFLIITLPTELKNIAYPFAA